MVKGKKKGRRESGSTSAHDPPAFLQPFTCIDPPQHLVEELGEDTTSHHHAATLKVHRRHVCDDKAALICR